MKKFNLLEWKKANGFNSVESFECYINNTKDEVFIYKFQCLRCKHTHAIRPPRDAKYTFLEGSYYCAHCGRKLNYTSDDWFLFKKITYPKQQSLF